QPPGNHHPEKRAVSLLRNRWLLGALAFIAFAIVAWSVGDLVVFGGWRPFETPAGRAILIAIAAAAWIGWELRRARQARRENEQLPAVLAGGGGARTRGKGAPG